LFTNILIDFAIIVNIWSASPSSHSCLLFLKEHQNETACKMTLQNVFAYFMNPFLKSTNPWHDTEHITDRIMQPVDVFITNHLLFFGTYCFP
jgi:hypothetical protein